VENWLFWRYEGAISDDEAAYIRHIDDVIAVVSTSKSPLRALLERFRSFRLHGLFKTQPVCATSTPFEHTDAKSQGRFTNTL